MKIRNILNMVIYVEDGIWSPKNRWINLHLIVAKFLAVILCGSIAAEMQVQLITALNGDSMIIKFSNLLSLLLGLVSTAYLTKAKNIERVRRMYLTLSVIATTGIVLTNLFVVVEDSVVLRFIINTIIESSLMNLLSNSISDTINHKFGGTERTIYGSKSQVISMLAGFLGVCLAFFIHLDLNSLLIMEAIIYVVLLLEDMFVFKKLQQEVFGESEDSSNTQLKEAA